MDKLKSLTDRIRQRAAAGQSKRKGLRPRQKNPLDALPVTGNIEVDDAAESATVLDNLKATQRQVEKTMGQDYWCALVFVTKEQRDEFLRRMGWERHLADQSPYLDGVAVAQALGIKLTPEKIPFRELRKDRRLVEEVGIIPQEDCDGDGA